MSNTEFNNFAISFISTLSEFDYDEIARFDCIDKAQTSINLNTRDSGFYTPTAIKVKGVSGIMVLRQDGKVNYESKIRQKNGMYVVCILNKATDRRFEMTYSDFVNKR